jgi:hypothetical protein
MSEGDRVWILIESRNKSVLSSREEESRVQFFQAEKKRVGFSSFKQRRRE